MSQTKKQSAIEITANHASGFLLAWLVWHTLAAPMVDLYARLGYAYDHPYTGFAVTALFTVVSIARSYFWRRVFNKLHNKERKNGY